ncbi:hypothetical protein ABZ863_19775 [Saccharomonospora sp. NPDC046836]|uniref:hypothetical protein n=1 Tax=Saccharomonospora sp. NPDC046836 TaxID=3156921 RepID=UPI0033F44984
MRCTATIIGVGAGLLLLTGCGAEQAPPGSVPGSLPAATTSEPVREAAGEPARVDGAALPEGYPVDVSVAGDGRTLTVVGQEGGCSSAGAEVAEQRADRVTITMIETKPVSKDLACTMDMRYPPITVRLDAPLDGRLVVLRYMERKT